MRVKTAWRWLGEGNRGTKSWGNLGMKIAPGCGERKGERVCCWDSNPTSFSQPHSTVYPLQSLLRFIPHLLIVTFISIIVFFELPTFYLLSNSAAPSLRMWWVEEWELWPQAGGSIRRPSWEVADVSVAPLRTSKSPECLSVLYYIHTHTHIHIVYTHKCTGSTVLPLRIILSPSSRKCAVPCYDRWVAFRDGAAPTVCLSPFRMAAEWQLGPVHGFESVWQEKSGFFGLTRLLFQRRKETRDSEHHVA